jgi:hypothetical protein
MLVLSKHDETPNCYDIRSLWGDCEFRMNSANIDEGLERRRRRGSSTVVCYYNNIDD